MKYSTRENLKISGAVLLLTAFPSLDSVEFSKEEAAPPKLLEAPQELTSLCFENLQGEYKCALETPPCTTDMECYKIFKF